LTLAPLVPHGEVENYSWKEPALGDTKKESRHKEACKILYDTEQGCNDTPGDGKRG